MLIKDPKKAEKMAHKVDKNLPLGPGKEGKGACGCHQQLVADLLEIVTAAHREHLNTRSYSRHMALGGLYEGLPALLDVYAEIVVRAFGEIPSRTSVKDYHDMKFDKHLGLVYDYVNEVYKLIPSGHPCLEDSLGAIQSLLSATRYKLERLTTA